MFIAGQLFIAYTLVREWTSKIVFCSSIKKILHFSPKQFLRNLNRNLNSTFEDVSRETGQAWEISHTNKKFIMLYLYNEYLDVMICIILQIIKSECPNMGNFSLLLHLGQDVTNKTIVITYHNK